MLVVYIAIVACAGSEKITSRRLRETYPMDSRDELVIFAEAELRSIGKEKNTNLPVAEGTRVGFPRRYCTSISSSRPCLTLAIGRIIAGGEGEAMKG